MVGGLPHGGVNPAEIMMQQQTNQQAIMHQNPNPMNIPQGPMGLRGAAMVGPRSTLNESAEMQRSRQENLARIHQLRQTLAAAQQQELQYQTQLEVNIFLIRTRLFEKSYKRILSNIFECGIVVTRR